MNEKDFLLVSYLRQDSRMSLTKLSKKTSIPISTIFNKVQSNFNGKILKYASLIDFAAFGYNLKVYLMIKVKKDQKESLLKSMQKDLNVNNLFKINNSWDLLAECIFKDLNHLEGFLESLEAKFTVKGKEVHYVLSDLKREAFLSNPEILAAVE